MILQFVFTCSKLTAETPEQYMKSVQKLTAKTPERCHRISLILLTLSWLAGTIILKISFKILEKQLWVI